MVEQFMERSWKRLAHQVGGGKRNLEGGDSAKLLGVYIRDPHCWKLPCMSSELDRS